MGKKKKAVELPDCYKLYLELLAKFTEDPSIIKDQEKHHTGQWVNYGYNPHKGGELWELHQRIETYIQYTDDSMIHLDCHLWANRVRIFLHSETWDQYTHENQGNTFEDTYIEIVFPEIATKGE